jgi:hypothetical protein
VLGTDRPVIKSKDVLQRVRHIIASTVTPSWIGSVPLNFGDAKAGTIKADQWRLLWTIYLPLAFVSLWGSGVPDPLSDASTMGGVLHVCMALSAAVTLASYRSTSQKRAEAFRQSLCDHVRGLQSLFPGFLLPSHHLAFHIYDFLLLFGPSHVFWCFPFEQLIGRLQRQCHNHRFGTIFLSWPYHSDLSLGQLESTLLHSFIKGGKLRQWLERQDCPAAIRECKSLLDKSYGKGHPPSDDKFVRAPVPQELSSLLKSTHFNRAANIRHCGVTLSRHTTHLGNSLVLAHIGGRQSAVQSVPVKIRHIFRLDDGSIQLAISRLRATPAGTVDPFEAFPHFNARLYSSQFDHKLEIIKLDQVDNHYAFCTLSSEYSAVVDLSRVGGCLFDML